MKSFWYNSPVAICFILRFGVSLLIIPKPQDLIHGERFPIYLQPWCPSRAPQRRLSPDWRRLKKSCETPFTGRRRRRRRQGKAPSYPWPFLFWSTAAQIHIYSKKHKIWVEKEARFFPTEGSPAAFVASLLAILSPSEFLFSPLCSVAAHMMIDYKQHKREASEEARLSSTKVGLVAMESSFFVNPRPSIMRSKLTNNRFRTMLLQIYTNRFYLSLDLMINHLLICGLVSIPPKVWLLRLVYSTLKQSNFHHQISLICVHLDIDKIYFMKMFYLSLLKFVYELRLVTECLLTTLVYLVTECFLTTLVYLDNAKQNSRISSEIGLPISYWIIYFDRSSKATCVYLLPENRIKRINIRISLCLSRIWRTTENLENVDIVIKNSSTRIWLTFENLEDICKEKFQSDMNNEDVATREQGQTRNTNNEQKIRNLSVFISSDDFEHNLNTWNKQASELNRGTKTFGCHDETKSKGVSYLSFFKVRTKCLPRMCYLVIFLLFCPQVTTENLCRLMQKRSRTKHRRSRHTVGKKFENRSEKGHRS